MARRELLLHAPIPPGNVHRMEADDARIGRAAHNYEGAMRRVLQLHDGFPVFHLVLLGMGADGHTASLFPGSSLLRETSRWVSTPILPKLNTRRMTLTLPVLEAAERVLFLVTGSEKAATLREVLRGKSEPPLPAQMLKPRHGERIFVVDEAAAALLEPATELSSTPEKPGPSTPRSSL
jgi:6-phosphogluconolactonase